MILFPNIGSGRYRRVKCLVLGSKLDMALLGRTWLRACFIIPKFLRKCRADWNACFLCSIHLHCVVFGLSKLPAHVGLPCRFPAVIWTLLAWDLATSHEIWIHLSQGIILRFSLFSLVVWKLVCLVVCGLGCLVVCLFFRWLFGCLFVCVSVSTRRLLSRGYCTSSLPARLQQSNVAISAGLARFCLRLVRKVDTAYNYNL